jgi:putative ABC transport system substrate-binding protein
LDELPALARELVSRRSDVLITGPYTFVRALKQETTTIPIVMLGTPDPVANGLVTNLARPEGNVTGVAWFGLLSKQMELLKEIVPHVRRVALIADPSDRPLPPELSNVGKEHVTSAASTPGITWQYFPPALGNDYDEIFSRLAADHFDAAFIPSIPANSQNATRIIQLALRHRIPTVGDQADWANGGLLLGYGHDLLWGARHAAEYVDKILRGAKPSELPVEQPQIELAWIYTRPYQLTLPDLK